MEKKPHNYIKWLWIFLLSPILIIFLLVTLIGIGVFGDLPQVEELVNPKNNLATVVYSGDMKIIGKYYSENRVNVIFKLFFLFFKFHIFIVVSLLPLARYPFCKNTNDFTISLCSPSLNVFLSSKLNIYIILSPQKAIRHISVLFVFLVDRLQESHTFTIKFRLIDLFIFTRIFHNILIKIIFIFIPLDYL
jgi:hypothetical protein